MRWTDTDKFCLEVVKNTLREVGKENHTEVYDRYIKWLDELQQRTADKKPLIKRIRHAIARCWYYIQISLSYDLVDQKRAQKMRDEWQKKIDSLK